MRPDLDGAGRAAGCPWRGQDTGSAKLGPECRFWHPVACTEATSEGCFQLVSLLDHRSMARTGPLLCLLLWAPAPCLGTIDPAQGSVCTEGETVRLTPLPACTAPPPVTSEMMPTGLVALPAAPRHCACVPLQLPPVPIAVPPESRENGSNGAMLAYFGPQLSRARSLPGP